MVLKQACAHFFLVKTEGKYPMSAPKHHVKKWFFFNDAISQLLCHEINFFYKPELNMFITTSYYLLNVLFIIFISLFYLLFGFWTEVNKTANNLIINSVSLDLWLCFSNIRFVYMYLWVILNAQLLLSTFL